MPQKTPGWTWIYGDDQGKRTNVFRHAKTSHESTWPPSAIQGNIVELVRKLYPQGYLPVEIALMIADRLGKRGLADLAAVNHEFYESASDILYHTVTLDLRNGKDIRISTRENCLQFFRLLRTIVTNDGLAARVRRFSLHVGMDKTSTGESIISSRKKWLYNGTFKRKYHEIASAILKRLKLPRLPLTCCVAVNYVMVEQMTGLEHLELAAEDFMWRRSDTDDVIRHYLAQIHKAGRHPSLRTAVLTAAPLNRDEYLEDKTWPRPHRIAGWVNRDMTPADPPRRDHPWPR